MSGIALQADPESPVPQVPRGGGTPAGLSPGEVGQVRGVFA